MLQLLLLLVPSLLTLKLLRDLSEHEREFRLQRGQQSLRRNSGGCVDGARQRQHGRAMRQEQIANARTPALTSTQHTEGIDWTHHSSECVSECASE